MLSNNNSINLLGKAMISILMKYNSRGAMDTIPEGSYESNSGGVMNPIAGNYDKFLYPFKIFEKYHVNFYYKNYYYKCIYAL